MSLQRKLKQQKARRALRVRKKIKASGKLRVSVFKSLQHFYGQIIDDAQGVTLASCSTLELDVQGDKKEQARLVGLELARKALERGIKSVALDRGEFLFHGRIESFAQGLRDGGLQV